MNDKLNVPILLGTAREGRQSEKVAKFVLVEAHQYGFDSQLIDVRDYLTTLIDKTKHDTPWAGIVKKANGLIIVSPEYNHGYPGELKLLLDSLYKEYLDLPIGICGVSGGLVGGARVAMALEPVLIEIGARVVRPINLFPQVQNLFDATGNPIDPKITDKLKLMFDNIIKFAR
ncbi:MAG: NADPH-dependent FMN reductase [Patescibacteria group bacterium]